MGCLEGLLTPDSPYDVHIFHGRLEVGGRRMIAHVDHVRKRIVVSIHPMDSESDRIAALMGVIRDQVTDVNGNPPMLGEILLVPADGKVE